MTIVRFKTRIAPEQRRSGDEITNLLIFGITGLTGGALLDATLGCAWFRIHGFTRSRQGRVYEDLVTKGVKMFTGDMNKPQTLVEAMRNIDTVFLSTAYWDSRDVGMEYSQGVNVINLAIENNVKHLIYLGTDYSAVRSSERCLYLEGKALVENYIVSMGIPFTILHVGFYFENLLSVFKPHRTGQNKFALAIPMEHVALNCGSAYDFGCCIGKIAIERSTHMFRTVNLATAYMTVSDIASKLGNHFNRIKFYDSKITLTEYKTLELPEIEELSSMFAHYQTLPKWDQTHTHELYPTWHTFEQWITDNEKHLLGAIYGKISKVINTQCIKKR